MLTVGARVTVGLMTPPKEMEVDKLLTVGVRVTVGLMVVVRVVAAVVVVGVGAGVGDRLFTTLDVESVMDVRRLNLWAGETVELRVKEVRFENNTFSKLSKSSTDKS